MGSWRTLCKQSVGYFVKRFRLVDQVDSLMSVGVGIRALIHILRLTKRVLRIATRRAYLAIRNLVDCCILVYLTAMGKGISGVSIRSKSPHRENGPPRALILSLSPVFDDPRVRRQAVTLERYGWLVELVGYEGRSKGSNRWTLIALDKSQIRVRGSNRCLVPLSMLWWRFAETYYWNIRSNRYILDRLPPSNWTLVIANDYPTVPIAAAVARTMKVPYVVDCHEYARAQKSLQGIRARLRWMFFDRPYVDAINRRYLSNAAAVSTVCDGIADLLHRDYNLPVRPTVLRSLPEYREYAFRPCGKTIRILYHGAAAPTRGLEQAIDSVPQWRREFLLSLRLVASPQYLDSLKERVARNGVTDRVEFLDPVPFTELVDRAAQADVGYCVLEDFSPQRRFSSPNKFFEYAMAGLAVVCSDLPELRKIGDQFGHCVFVERYDSASIADCINNLCPNAIDELKKRSLAAARELCWENEQDRMVNAYLRASECMTADSSIHRMS